MFIFSVILFFFFFFRFVLISCSFAINGYTVKCNCVWSLLVCVLIGNVYIIGFLVYIYIYISRVVYVEFAQKCCGRCMFAVPQD